MENSFDWQYVDDGEEYYITMTDNVFDYLENDTAGYSLTDPFEWTYTINYIINYQII